MAKSAFGSIIEDSQFLATHCLDEPDQASLDAFGDDAETLYVVLEQFILEAVAP